MSSYGISHHAEQFVFVVGPKSSAARHRASTAVMMWEQGSNMQASGNTPSPTSLKSYTGLPSCCLQTLPSERKHVRNP